MPESESAFIIIIYYYYYYYYIYPIPSKCPALKKGDNLLLIYLFKAHKNPIYCRVV